ncbi:MAG: ribonuclease HII [Pyrinomonadaceae bacterium]|nr:ribonuclease HII [Pyrinomonadaceae bacterium]
MSSGPKQQYSGKPLFDDHEVPVTIGTVFEESARDEGFSFVAGVDEVGRGCLAGPVVAGAVILDISKPLPEGLNDSKKISKKKLPSIAKAVRERAIAYSIGQIDAQVIDRINILEATKRAMLSAIDGLKPAADMLLIDALQLKESTLPQKPIIKGDSVSVSIAAASIVAKVYRDDLMKVYDQRFPQYGFAKHVGYGTKAHFEALREVGPCELHRVSFRGVG